jgi:CDP-glucose 4,6-dehydratase
MQINKKFWKNKKVLITGHSGFKGGWLSVILKYLGANIYGYALSPEGKKSLYNLLKINKILKEDLIKNILDFKTLNGFIKKNKPEIIFHLAAQSSVIKSFKDSKNTILTNIIGTSNLLEVIKSQNSVKCLVIVTTDKVYQNYKFKKSFKEESILGGDDIYSGSKACCEILANSYYKSFFSNNNINIATVRAGNCFGGGDFTKDRIVKDCLDSFFHNKKLLLRSPMAQRPWQHVIEPLIGYITLAQKLFSKEGNKFVGPWNFGPNDKQNMRVIDLAKLIKKKIKSKSNIIVKINDKRFINKKIKVFESKFLNIDSKKALRRLKWKSKLSIKKALDLTVEWHKAYISKKNLLKITLRQISNYLE